MDPVTSQRFELVRALGEGASGAVFLALDRETGEHVALKKLFKLDQHSVLRFKREFRSLADIHHPNLVKLYDLHRGEDAWFISMEYVSGKDFRQHFLDSAAANDNATASLSKVFFDLACGVNAIHRAGMLHRDLKPSNALISDTGRVVVLDFGLVREIEGSALDTQEGTTAGTPAYMPPEQALGSKLTEASDWYAFGAMLYEAISGLLPIDGRTVTALLQRKLSFDPQPLSAGAPGPVLDLCMRLLARSPERRPSGDEVLDVLAAASGESSRSKLVAELTATAEPVLFAHATPSTLFGREAQLARLHAACECAAESSVVVHVRGASGSGKSALVERFLDDASRVAFDPPVVLRSRCYEREAMPFKALDGVMDALVGHLSKLDDVSCAYLLPPDIVDLVRLFPVLDRLNAVRRVRSGQKLRADGEALVRRRAEQALRALVTRVAGQRRLILWVDDLQWGDLDSASVLLEWLQLPLDAPVLIILSYRSEETHTSASLALLLAQPELAAEQAHWTIELEPLSAEHVRELCTHRLAQSTAAPAPMIERIVREADGNPFLAQQLAAIAEAKLARSDTSVDDLSMESLVQRASALMGESAHSLLKVLAIAGRPLTLQLALSAAGVQSAGRSHVHTLRGLRLVRSRDVVGARLLEVYHDRVREVVQAGLPADERRHIYARLLSELERQHCEDHDWLHALALGAGEAAMALRQGLLAAQRASDGLAFERASELYGTCLSLLDGSVETYSVWTLFAQAQAHCGRGYDAAKAYLSAAEHAPSSRRFGLLQLAASHLVRSGRFEEGERIVQQVLSMQGLRIPSTQSGLLAALAWEHGRIALRPLDVPSSRTQAPSGYADKVDLFTTLSIETQVYAPLRSALFQARALRLGLDYCDSQRVARVLCMSAVIACLAGTQRAARRSAKFLNRAELLLERGGNEEVRLELLCARTICAHFLGHVDRVLEPAYQVERMSEAMASRGEHGNYYYAFAVQMARISALQSLGRLLEARELLREFVARARATDNLGAILQVTMNRVVDEQARELCAGSRARLDAEHEKLPTAEFSVLSAVHLAAVMRAACANRDFAWAFERLDELWVPYLRSPVHRSAYLACLAHTTHARLMLNHYVETGASGDPETLVRSDLKQIARLPASLLGDFVITRTRARVASLRGDRRQAIAMMRQSLARFERTSMLQEIGHDRYSLGLLLGGAEGEELVRSAQQDLLGCGISDPAGNMRAYIPELLRR